MLTIRKPQMEALAAYTQQAFEERMVRHLVASFPKQISALTSGKSGDEPVRILVKQGIERAERYQIVSRRDVARYIEVMVAVDAKFDERKDMAWAREILLHHDFSSQAKMDLIYQRLRDPENAHLLKNESQHVPIRH